MAPERVLIVDDEETFRVILCGILEENGYRAVAARSGEEALEAFRKEAFPLVIADIRMEGMSGIRLLQEIRTIEPDTQVIIMTSYASLDTAVVALRSEAYDYLIKPFEDLGLIPAAAARAFDKVRLVRENRELIEELRRKNAELSQLNTVLSELATHDGLTGLFNHRYFQEALARELSRSRRYGHFFSFLFIDVDHFKRFNDTHGHVQGDAVLRELAGILKERCRRADVVARYGGEEFVVLLPETQAQDAYVLAEKIRKAVEEHPFPGAERQPLGKVTVSIGVSGFPENGEDPDTLIRYADHALYKAKAKGRNIVV